MKVGRRAGKPSSYWVVVCVYVAAMLAEGVVLFGQRTVPLSIEGAMPIEVEAFAEGARIAHEFLMVGDGLTAVSVRFSAARPVRMRVSSVLSEGDEHVAGGYVNLYRWISEVALEPGVTWKRFDFPPVPRSSDRVYTFQIQLLDGVLTDERDRTPRERLPVAIMASLDNPPRGGVLQIRGERQQGSLYLRAHGPGETAYDRFRLSVGSRLPAPLRNREVQICTALLYQWALCVFAYALTFGEQGDVHAS